MIRKNRPIPGHTAKLLIFDLDGTLIDSREDLANSINAMLKHFGKKELPHEVIASYIGDGAPMLVRRSLGDPDDENFVQDAVLYFMSWYREHKLDNTYVYEGVKESLDAIQKSRDGELLKMAVLSNKPVGPSRAIVEALGLSQYFFQVYGGNSFHTKKPDPTGVQALLEEAEVAAEETVIIGDSDIDVLTARNSGIYSVGVTYGLAPHTLEDAPPDVLIDSPRELALILGARDQCRLEFQGD
ncbi:MAG TPA: HAD-IA family hydrolase [Candidatus Angelobacter sp.]|jgi:phosphoglycolate phosphatase|nr:HAD-IA family hydrolase [Candidatus Angelobacter sp.]